MNTLQSIVVLPVALFAVAATAQTQRTGDSNARAMQQVQQLSSERTQLKAENEKLKQELESAKKQLAAATSGQSSLQQRTKAAEEAAARDAGTSQQNAEALEKARSQLQELIGRFRETGQALKEVEADRNLARGQLQTREREFAVCVDRNLALYQVNTEVLDRLDKKGVWNSLTEKEPFTKIQRNRLENLIDGYRERAADLRVNSNVGQPKN